MGSRNVASLEDRVGQIKEAGQKKVEALQTRESGLQERLEKTRQLVERTRQEDERAKKLLAETRELVAGPQKRVFEEFGPEIAEIQKELQEKSRDLEVVEAELAAVLREVKLVQRELLQLGELKSEGEIRDEAVERDALGLLTSGGVPRYESRNRGGSFVVGGLGSYRREELKKYADSHGNLLGISLRFRDGLREALRLSESVPDREQARSEYEEMLEYRNDDPTGYTDSIQYVANEDISTIRELMERFKVSPEPLGL